MDYEGHVKNTKNKFQKEKKELLETGSTQFVYDTLLFYVEEGIDYDYVYDIYSPKGEIDDQSPIDGGMFNGSVDDLFSFMTFQNEHLKELL